MFGCYLFASCYLFTYVLRVGLWGVGWEIAETMLTTIFARRIDVFWSVLYTLCPFLCLFVVSVVALVFPSVPVPALLVFYAALKGKSVVFFIMVRIHVPWPVSSLSAPLLNLCYVS